MARPKGSPPLIRASTSDEHSSRKPPKPQQVQKGYSVDDFDRPSIPPKSGHADLPEFGHVSMIQQVQYMIYQLLVIVNHSQQYLNGLAQESIYTIAKVLWTCEAHKLC